MRSVSELICPHRPACPGCPRFGRSGLAETAYAPLAELARAHGLPSPRIHQGARTGFRHRARLAVRGRVGQPKIGIFESGSHRVVHIPECRIHHPLINDVLEAARKSLVDTRLAPYSDAAHAGQIRYLQIVVERASESAQLVVVTRDDAPRGLDGLFGALRARLGERLHSLWWNGQPERTNSVLGPQFVQVCGPPEVVERQLGVSLFYPPGAFGQNHLPLAEELARRVGELVRPGLRVLELYAGVGALGLPLAERSQQLVFNELGEHSLAGLRRGIDALPPELRSKCAVQAGSAGDASELVSRAELVIVDPPRKGLDEPLLARLEQAGPERVIYVSCGLPSFLRDSARLLASGRFRLAALEAFALFPYTEHVETVAVFDANR